MTLNFKFCVAFEMFITKPQDQTVNVGGDVKFICQYKPEELSSKWYKGTDLVQYALEQERLRIDNTSLMILDVKLEDQGTYTCKVGQDEESAFLKISTSVYIKDYCDLVYLSAVWFC
jgi:hypothetical protein